jgi:hypothetical protein
MKSIVQIALVFLAFGAGGTWAADAPPKGPVASRDNIDFVTLDANTDGSLSAAEVQNIDDLRAEFGKLDVNHDEKLSPSEFSKWRRAGNTKDAMPLDPSTGPSGSNGAQHMTGPRK